MTLLIACCIAPVACSSDEEPNANNTKTPQAIGHYTLDGVEHDILAGVYAEANGYYEFVFTPCESLLENRHTTIMLSILAAFDGVEADVERIYHNDDYIFSYEDNFYYYSRYNALKGGKIIVTRRDEGDYSVMMEQIKMPDGRDFSLSFDGKLPSMDEILE